MKFKSLGLRDTGKFVEVIYKKALKNIKAGDNFVIGLEGDLGSGKTAFTKLFLKKLGVKETVTSPTFTIMKRYAVSNDKGLRNIYHIDAYRVETPDILNLGFKKIIKEEGAIIIVEWADQIKKIMPKDAFWIKIEHGQKKNERIFNY